MENKNGLKTKVTYQTTTIHNVKCHQLQEIIFSEMVKMQFVGYGIFIFPSLKTYLQLLSELQLEMIAQLFPTLSEINKDNKDTQTFSLYKHLYFDLL